MCDEPTPDSMVLKCSDGTLKAFLIIRIKGWKPDWFFWKATDYPKSKLTAVSGDTGTCCFVGTEEQCEIFIRNRHRSSNEEFLTLNTKMDLILKKLDNQNKKIDDWFMVVQKIQNEINELKGRNGTQIIVDAEPPLPQRDVVWVGGKLISLDSLKSAAKVPNEVKGLKCLMNDYFGDYIRGKSMADLSANDKEACKEIIRLFIEQRKSNKSLKSSPESTLTKLFVRSLHNAKYHLLRTMKKSSTTNTLSTSSINTKYENEDSFDECPWHI